MAGWLHTPWHLSAESSQVCFSRRCVGSAAILQPELVVQTVIVNYGESGRRNRGLGYTIEVTIQFISAKTHAQICSCTAEGQGETEADDIRQAITRCLSGLLSK